MNFFDVHLYIFCYHLHKAITQKVGHQLSSSKEVNSFSEMKKSLILFIALMTTLVLAVITEKAETMEGEKLVSVIAE